MPVLRGAVTLCRFHAEWPEKKPRPKDPRRSLPNALRRNTFEPLDRSGEEERSAGWVELDDHDGTGLAAAQVLFDGTLLVTWRVDLVRVPAAIQRAEVERWARAYEAKQGRPPTRTDKAAEKELILKRLRKRAFITTRTHDVVWNLDSDEVQVWSASRAAVEEIHVTIEESFGVRLAPTSPGARLEAAGLDPARLKPTEALFGVEALAEARGLG